MEEDNDNNKLLYCSFCGKSQHEVSRLIAGPSVFVCEECTVLCVDILLDKDNGGEDLAKKFISSLNPSSIQRFSTPEGVEQIIREIHFPPEYQQAGITILSNYSSILRKKYKDENVKISIQQAEDKVILIVESDEGIIERIEETMKSYGMVLKGKISVEEFSNNPYEVAEIKQQLRIAQIQLESQRDLLTIEKEHSKQLSSNILTIEKQYNEVVGILTSSISDHVENTKFLQKTLEYSMSTHSKLAKKSLDSLIAIIKADKIYENQHKVKKDLIQLKNEDPKIFESLMNFSKSISAGVIGNQLYSWMVALSSSLPK